MSDDLTESSSFLPRFTSFSFHASNDTNALMVIKSALVVSYYCFGFSRFSSPALPPPPPDTFLKPLQRVPQSLSTCQCFGNLRKINLLERRKRGRLKEHHRLEAQRSREEVDEEAARTCRKREERKLRENQREKWKILASRRKIRIRCQLALTIPEGTKNDS